VVVGLEEAESPASLGQVLDVARHGVDEVVHLRDEGRDERGAEPADPDRQQQVRDADREAPPPDPAAHQEVDERVERDGEEERDHDPREHLPREPDHLQQRRNREHDPEHGEDRPCAEADDPLIHRAQA
jgi:hypothetical protein